MAFPAVSNISVPSVVRLEADVHWPSRLEAAIHAAATPASCTEPPHPFVEVSISRDGQFHGMSTATERVIVPLSVFLQRFLRGGGEPGEPHMYMLQHDLAADSSSLGVFLREALPPPHGVFCRERYRCSNLWMSPGLTSSNTHYDDDDNALLVLAGRKRVALAPPSLIFAAREPRSLDPFSTAISGSDFHHAPWIDLFELHDADGSTSGFPSTLPAVRVSVFDVSVGHALIIPAGWWHSVQSECGTVAVNHWYAPAYGDFGLGAAAACCDESSADGAADVATAPLHLLSASPQWPHAARLMLTAGLDELHGATLENWRRLCLSQVQETPRCGSCCTICAAGGRLLESAAPLSNGSTASSSAALDPAARPRAVESCLVSLGPLGSLAAMLRVLDSAVCQHPPVLAAGCGGGGEEALRGLCAQLRPLTWAVLAAGWREPFADAELSRAFTAGHAGCSSCTAPPLSTSAEEGPRGSGSSSSPHVLQRVFMRLNAAVSGGGAPEEPGAVPAAPAAAAAAAAAPFSDCVDAACARVRDECLQHLLSSLAGVPVALMLP